jgi:hypothetical protein
MTIVDTSWLGMKFVMLVVCHHIVDFVLVRNPTLAKCGGEAQHFQSWGFGVLRDSRMFRVRQQGPKTPRIEVFLVSLKRS